MRRRLIIGWIGGAIVVTSAVIALWHLLIPPAVSTYVPHAQALRRADVYLFRAEGKARGIVWFYGNDVAFWKAHAELASIFAIRGYDVVGFDLRRFFDATSVSGSRRDSLVARTVARLLQRARHEFGDEALPVVLAGHSMGADCAIWTAAHVRIHPLAGVLMLSPTRRSHLYATMRDRMFIGEPTEPGSYAAADMVAHIPPDVPIVVFRGDHDPHNGGDRRLVRAVLASGHGSSAREAYRVIPFAGHSLRSLIVAGPIVAHALDDLIDAWYSSCKRFKHVCFI